MAIVSRQINIASETVTENIFRNFYGAQTFIEKSAIPRQYGFQSKKSNLKGYPDFLREEDDYVIVVEAKPLNHENATEEVQHYMVKNKINKDVIGMAISGQTEASMKVSYFLRINGTEKCTKITSQTELLKLDNIYKIYWRHKYGEATSPERLTLVLKSLNRRFNDTNKVRDTDRSLFFSGLMIALKDNTFRNTYKSIQSPTVSEISPSSGIVLESHNLNQAILEAITRQLANKINSLSKEYSWKDKFSFIKNIDYSLLEYKEIVNIIEEEIFKPFQNDEKRDILAKAYKIFLSRAGKIDNKNIILTPDHVKSLMIELAELHVNDVVLDTCTGTGGFLMEAMETLISKAGQNESVIERIKENQLIGFEIDTVLFALACSNMFLHGDGRTNLIFRSSLLNDKNENVVNHSNADLMSYIKSLKPTKCIINPPYENNNAIKFAKQALDYLEPNGKLVIIMPTPTLTKNQDGLTEEILKIAKLDFVIKMPNKLFSEQKRTVNTSIFGFTKTPQNKASDVLFYNLEDDGFVSIQHKGRVDKYNKWNGIMKRTVDVVLNSREVEELSEKRKIYKDDILNCAGVQKMHGNNFQMMKIGDLFKIEDGSLASEDSEEGEYDFVTGSEEWKKHSEFEHDKEALVYVIAASGSLGRAHYVNGKFVASNLCLILTAKDPKKYPVNLKFYSVYFSQIRKKIVSDLAEGTSKLTIGKDAFREYYIDYVNIKKQDQFVSTFVEPFLVKTETLKAEIKIQEKDMSSAFVELF